MLGALLASGTMFAYLLASGFQEAEHGAAIDSANLGRVLDTKLNDILLRAVSEANDIASDVTPEFGLSGGTGDHIKLGNEDLADRLKDFPELEGLEVLDASGNRIFSAGTVPQLTGGPAQFLFFEALRTNAAAGTQFSEAFRMPGTNVLSMSISVAMRDGKGAFRGVAVAVLNLDSLRTFFSTLDVGKKGALLVRRTDNFDLVMRGSTAPTNQDGPLPATSVVRRLIAGGSNNATLLNTTGQDGVARIISARRMSGFPFVVVVSLNRDEIFAGWYERSVGMAVGSLAILAALLTVMVRARRAERREEAAQAELDRNRARLTLLATAFEHSGEAISVSDADRRIIAVNDAFTRVTGYSFAEVEGKSPLVLADDGFTDEDYQEMRSALETEGLWRGELRGRRKDNSLYPCWSTLSAVRDPSGALIYTVGAFTDISERKAQEERIAHLALHDSLTGLPNRLNLHSRLEQALAKAKRADERIAVIFIDLDRFKQINDTLGHAVGDGLLKEVAQRLSRSVRESDVVARLGGDEFVVVLTDVRSLESTNHKSQRMLGALTEPYLIEGNELVSTPSLGISMYPEDGQDVVALMKNADTAMYHAKSQGRNQAQFFDHGLNQAATERMLLERDLRLALPRGELLLYYQPQIEMANNKPIGFEALVRWKHPVRGMVSPGTFIPLAEEIGIITEIGEWVLREALHQLRSWRDQGIPVKRIAVNLSADQLRGDDFQKIVEEVLAAEGIEPADLELEITESVAMQDTAKTIRILDSLREYGVELAMDDFGTGYSSLSYLKMLPIQRLKLDQSFVRGMETDPSDAAICAATIALSHSLGLEVVAEGVETAAQLEQIKRLRGDVVQGYFFSKPLPAEDAGSFFAEASKNGVRSTAA